MISIFGGGITGFISRKFHSHPSSLNVLKNKEINRNKKQQTWMKKINAKELPRKKFGNKLGTVAKQLYLKYYLGNSEKDNVSHKHKYDDGVRKNYQFTVLLEGGKSKKQRGKVNMYRKEGENKSIYYADEEHKLLSNKNERILKQNEKKDVRKFTPGKNEGIPTADICRSVIKEEPLNSTTYASVWDDVCNELRFHLPFLQPYSITTALNYLSKVNYDEYDIFKLVAENIDERWLKNFNIKDLSLLLLSYSRLNSKYDSFINLVSRELLYKISFANLEDISLIAYAYTKMKIYDYEVFLHLCNETKHRIADELKKGSSSNRSSYGAYDNPGSICQSKQNEDCANSDIYHMNRNVDRKIVLRGKGNSVNLEKEKETHDIKFKKRNGHSDVATMGTGNNQKGKNTQSTMDIYNPEDYKNNRHLTETNTNTSNCKVDFQSETSEIKEDKKYSNVCLFVYCLGKNKHRDNNLFYLILEYVNFEKLNNIDISNLSYTFCLYNIYMYHFYENFCLKSFKIIDQTEPLQKVVILPYLLKSPHDNMVYVYFSYIRSIRKEIKENNMYKEVPLLNICLNTFSSDVFLNFLLKMAKLGENVDFQKEKVSQAIFMQNFLVDYTDFFINSKKKLCSRDFPKILNILLKIGSGGDACNEKRADSPLMYCDNRVHIKEVDVLVEEVLDAIIREIKDIHEFDLVHIKRILSLNFNHEWECVKLEQKRKTILNFVSSR
ncbi:hypothetical protein, conserved [Plasmodium ovale wallikeri]|uniref:Uncharacterized protein n=2 Tax=Plasmodium ovale TaxID=36330 RepID=A0A1C3KT20_PLAOA|nr:hypothetical protein, conserved [Plasmodium ovale wallikeri]SBT77297.1 conserved Plasmodium protein, unknown function [Plasmodium ovale]